MMTPDFARRKIAGELNRVGRPDIRIDVDLEHVELSSNGKCWGGAINVLLNALGRIPDGKGGPDLLETLPQ